MFIIAYTHTHTTSRNLHLQYPHAVSYLMNIGTKIPHNCILSGAKFCTENVTAVECVVATWYRYSEFTVLVLEEHQDQNIIL
jgi:hypothetical protein